MAGYRSLLGTAMPGWLQTMSDAAIELIGTFFVRKAQYSD
jgi:hypothetical protein